MIYQRMIVGMIEAAARRILEEGGFSSQGVKGMKILVYGRERRWEFEGDKRRISKLFLDWGADEVVRFQEHSEEEVEYVLPIAELPKKFFNEEFDLVFMTEGLEKSSNFMESAEIMKKLVREGGENCSFCKDRRFF